MPDGCLEAFEVRAVLYYTDEGEVFVAVDFPREVAKHEAVGVLRMAENIVLEDEPD